MSPAGEFSTSDTVSGDALDTAPSSAIERVRTPPFAASATCAPFTESLPITVVPLKTVMTAWPRAKALGRSGSNVKLLTTATSNVPPLKVAELTSAGSALLALAVAVKAGFGAF